MPLLTPPPAAVYPVGPALSMYDPIYLGINEFGEPVYIRLIYRNLLAGGEPGGGKSALLNIIAAHAALSAATRLVLFDGKQVELGPYDDIADEFVGPDLDHAITTLLRLQKVMDNRYTWLRAHDRRKVEPRDGLSRHRVDLRRDRAVLRHPRAPSSSRNCSFPCCVTWWPVAGPPPCRSSPRPSGPAWTSSPRACATSSATAQRSAAPAAAAPTSSWATAGPRPGSQPPISPRSPPVSPTSSPKAASPARSRPPTCPIRTSPGSWTTRPGPATAAPPLLPG